MVSVCLPVYSHKNTTKEFEGVTCSDMSITEVAGEVAFFQHGEHSYAFLIDNTGRTLMHPLLPQPHEVSDTPVSLSVTALERNRSVRRHVIQSMMRWVGRILTSDYFVTQQCTIQGFKGNIT